jgi:hypothetical protein
MRKQQIKNLIKSYQKTMEYYNKNFPKAFYEVKETLNHIITDLKNLIGEI